ncbi:MAG: c-type cytochrome [Gemmatimonadetes bacterium]|nr:c-type cytochrome [Gemmatimonadota bacterium]MYA76222.1 c-type cytochrome [Gemmatimonadota bacterium]MYG17189.1 c-type cytochrome [Gemmatimonadota bacterium]MYH19085.1 c-type cytochrome [Gemmatimonadota bacterium]MYK98795.1 c-type cytochrome [Gemmatimonadota bacterium]
MCPAGSSDAATEFCAVMRLFFKYRAVPLCLFGLFLALPVFADQVGEANQVDGARPLDGAKLYEQACAACHGSDGRGRPLEERGFALELPDFTDCEFASREPDPDWHAVIHEGGPVRAFDRMMPAFGDALTDEEIYAILGHIRTFCTNDNWPRGEFNVPKPLFTEKAFPEDETVFNVRLDTDDSKAVIIEPLYEKRFGPRGMIEAKVPFGRRQTGGDDGAEIGFGDLTVGYRYALYHNLDRGNAFSIGGEVVLPTGDEDEGFGAGSTKLEPHVSFVQLFGDAFFQSQLQMDFAVTGSAPDKGIVRTAIGRTFTEGEYGRAWSPMVELLASRETVSGADVTLDLVPQMQVALNTRQHILLNVGVRVPVANSQGRKSQIVMYLLWDWFDGGFRDGW